MTATRPSVCVCVCTYVYVCVCVCVWSECDHLKEGSVNAARSKVCVRPCAEPGVCNSAGEV